MDTGSNRIKALIATASLLLLALPAVTAQRASEPSATDPAPLTMGETFTMASKPLGETRRINVYLPATYTQEQKTRFPVLYMPDGGMAEDFLHIAGLLQVLNGNGTMKPFVLIGIENTERRTGHDRPDDESRRS